MPRSHAVAVAFHEAGHAVLAWAFGIRVISITAVPTSKAAAEVRYAFTEDQDAALAANEPTFLRKLVLVGAGGLAADMSHAHSDAGTEPDYTFLGYDGDLTKAREKLTILEGHSNNFDWYLSAAMMLMKNPELWKPIEQVARILLDRGSLSPDELLRISINVPKIAFRPVLLQIDRAIDDMNGCHDA